MSIQTNELRVGNWILAGVMTKPLQVLTIGYEIKDGFSINKHIPIDHIRPIPLSPELLIKCGFNESPDWDKYDGCISVLDLGWLYIAMGVMGGVTLFDNEHKSTGTNIKHLHQLLNKKNR